MEETAPDSTPQATYTPPEPKKGMSGWVLALIIVAAVVVVCCVCLALALILGLVLAGPTVGNVFSTIVETVEAVTPVP
jgi:hypothetical protein